MQLLVSRGICRPLEYDGEIGPAIGARLEIIDWDKKEIVRKLDYKSPPENLGEGCKLNFTGGCSHAGKWYQCTSTEIVVYDIATWELERVITHPSFHDLHGCAIHDNELALANTGLEMVQFLDLEGNILREVNCVDEPTWERFDRNFDYRTVRSTKPHHAHPNHTFRVDDHWFVTRCTKQDAINLDNPEDHFETPPGQPHDGLLRGDKVYFTTTNAHLVICDAKTRKTLEIIDINEFNPFGDKIGWCRGLEVIGDYAYVGFSYLRMTKWAGAFQLAKDYLRGRKRKSHIELIDMKNKKLLDSFDFHDDPTSTIFTIMDYERVTGRPA